MSRASSNRRHAARSALRSDDARGEPIRANPRLYSAAVSTSTSARGPAGPVRARRRTFTLVAAVGLAAVGCSVLAPAVWSSGGTARRALGVKPLGAASTRDWSIGPRGALVTDRDTTQILVQMTRRSTASRTPAFTGDFDGSGGGDAQEVTCTAAPRSWTVRIDRTQTVALHCDAHVPSDVVEQMHFVYAGAQR